MKFAWMLIALIPPNWDTSVVDHVHTIEVNNYWGQNGFGNRARVIFWDWVYVPRKGCEEYHVVDTKDTMGEPFPVESGWMIVLSGWRCRRRVYARYYIKSDTWFPARAPDEIDTDTLEHSDRPGLLKPAKRIRLSQVNGGLTDADTLERRLLVGRYYHGGGGVHSVRRTGAVKR